MNTNELKPLENKLDILISLLAARCVDSKKLNEGAPFLDKLDVDRKVIATIYNTSPGAVRACISEAKRNNKSRSSKKE